MSKIPTESYWSNIGWCGIIEKLAGKRWTPRGRKRAGTGRRGGMPRSVPACPRIGHPANVVFEATCSPRLSPLAVRIRPLARSPGLGPIGLDIIRNRPGIAQYLSLDLYEIGSRRLNTDWYSVPSSIPFIPFPRQCSENAIDYKYTFRCYNEALFASDPVRIECGDCRFFRPFGLNLLACIIHSLQLGGRDVYFTPPQNSDALQYLSDQGFFTEFAFESTRHRLTRPSRSTSVQLRLLNEFDGTYFMQIAHWLSGNSDVPLEAAMDIVGVPLPEIINNVFDHSRSLIGCCVCAQAYPNERQLMFSITDLGVGFLSSLVGRYQHLTSDKDAIALAVQSGVSSKSTARNAGAGLYILTDWAKTYQGEVEIISGDGRWKQRPGGNQHASTLPFTFPGTCINLCIHTDPVIRHSRSSEY